MGTLGGRRMLSFVYLVRLSADTHFDNVGFV